MALFLRKREARHKDLIDSYYEQLNLAEKYRDRENAAAMVIQKTWHMLKLKWKFDSIQRSTRKVQRIWRGFLGRCKFMS